MKMGNNTQGGGIPDEVRKKIDIAFPRYNGYGVDMNDGALYGYSLASEEISRLKAENERLRGEVKKLKDENDDLHFTNTPLIN